MRKAYLSEAVSGIDDRYILEALEYSGSGGKRNISVNIRRMWLVAAVIVFGLMLSAFAVRLFSPLEGDALTLTGSYMGNGIVSIEAENRSYKKLEFQPQIKLVRWITDEEIPDLGGVPVFSDAVIPPRSTSTMTVDLSAVYDISLLEQSHPWEWYYLVLTNADFLYGHEWKCSVNFSTLEESAPESGEKRYCLDPNVLAGIEEELLPYFEDDYIGIFAANPMNYSYLQQAQELLLRCGKRIVPMADTDIISKPLPDGLIVDPAVPAEKQYTLAGDTSSVHDAFGKLVGATQYEHVKIIDVYLPSYAGSEDQAWTLPLKYFASFPRSEIHSEEDCAFIHGRIVAFRELAQYVVYEDEDFISFDVTHLFYTDLKDYVENVYAIEIAGGNSNVYMDEEVFQRIENIAAYYADNLEMITIQEYVEQIGPKCAISGQPEAESLVSHGLSGEITSNKPLQKVVFTVSEYQGEYIFTRAYIPEEPDIFLLETAEEVTDFIKALPDGVYELDVFVWVDSEFMSYSSLWSLIFTAGSASMPGVN